MELVFGLPALALLSGGSVLAVWGHKDRDWSTERIGFFLLILGLLLVISAGEVFGEPPAEGGD
jgi:hypothetical protein